MTEETFPAKQTVVTVDGRDCCGFCGGPAEKVTTSGHDYEFVRGAEVAITKLVSIEPCGHYRIEPV